MPTLTYSVQKAIIEFFVRHSVIECSIGDPVKQREVGGGILFGSSLSIKTCQKPMRNL